MTRDNTFLLIQHSRVHMSILPAHCTTRRGNKVSHSRLPVSLRHSPGWPSATTCGHHRWDWALPHGIAQGADSLHSVVLHHGDQLSTDQKRVLRPAGRTSDLGSRHPSSAAAVTRPLSTKLPIVVVHLPRLLLFIQRICPRDHA